MPRFLVFAHYTRPDEHWSSFHVDEATEADAATKALSEGADVVKVELDDATPA